MICLLLTGCDSGGAADSQTKNSDEAGAQGEAVPGGNASRVLSHDAGNKMDLQNRRGAG